MADTECLRLHDRHTLRMRDTAFARCVVCLLNQAVLPFHGNFHQTCGKISYLWDENFKRGNFSMLFFVFLSEFCDLV